MRLSSTLLLATTAIVFTSLLGIYAKAEPPSGGGYPDPENVIYPRLGTGKTTRTTNFDYEAGNKLYYRYKGSGEGESGGGGDSSGDDSSGGAIPSSDGKAPFNNGGVVADPGKGGIIEVSP